MSAADQLMFHVRARAATPAILLDDGSALSWRDLDDASTAFAARLLSNGAARGDRIAVVANNGPGAIVALLAHHRAGLIHVPVNPGYQAEEVEHVLADSGARVVLRDGDLPSWHPGTAAEENGRDGSLRVNDDDVAMLIYTSGTTGRSKGCMLTFGNVHAATASLTGLWEISSDDVIVHALPLFHVHGLSVALHGALLRGARTRLLSRFSPEAVVAAVAAGGTVFMGVPTMYRRLLEHLEKNPSAADVLARARLFCAGSAALPADDLEEFERRTGHRILERYGMSETLITMSNPLHGVRKAGSVGKPVPGVQMRIVDDELQVRGPGVMRGYWNNAELTQHAFDDGWLKTGDVVRMDTDGYVTIVGRTSTDILKVGGYKISTREIEEQLARVPGVLEVAVVGVPDREWGQRVVACVVVDDVLRARPSGDLLAELQEHVRLHAAKKPRGLLVMDALPRNAMGKVQKMLLAARAAREA